MYWENLIKISANGYVIELAKFDDFDRITSPLRLYYYGGYIYYMNIKDTCMHHGIQGSEV